MSSHFVLTHVNFGSLSFFVAVVLCSPSIRNYDFPADCGMQRHSPAQLSHIVLGKTLLRSTTAALPILPSEKEESQRVGAVDPCIILAWEYKSKFSHRVVIKITFPFLGKSQCTSSVYCSLLSLCLTSYSLNLSPPLFCTHHPSLLLPSLSFPSSSTFHK